jgi:LPS export ABC transporter permease LptG/LPS export ABC transporter permease LptF
MRLIDRYVVREILPPFVIALMVFTFLLIIPAIIEIAEQLIAKGVDWQTIARLMVTLIPQAIALTIPMSFLIGLLVAFGRLSADREVVVMMACGVSPFRLLRPVLLLAAVMWGATTWVMLEWLPNANQSSREIVQEVAMNRAEGEVRPRVFFDDFPNMVLYVREVSPTGAGWIDVMAADTSNGVQPVVYLAKRGRMVIDRQAKTIQMVLEDATRHTTTLNEPLKYEVARFDNLIMSLDPQSVFPKVAPPPGLREMGIADLQIEAAKMEALGESPHAPIMEIQKKFSIPFACLVFAVVGLALGASHRKDGKLASFVIGIAVIFVYYVIMFTAQAMAKGHWIPAWSAMWLPNIFIGAWGLFLLISRSRSADQPVSMAPPRWIMRRLATPDGAPAAAHGRRPRVRVVVRFPHFSLPRPSLLDIYVAQQYLKILAITIVGMLGLFYIATFIDLSDKLFKGQTTIGMLVQLLFWQTPQYLSYVIALAVLLSALVTIGLLTKNSELIVMRACGVSLYRTALPMVLFAILAGGVLLGLEENVLATSNRQARRLDKVIRTGSAEIYDGLNRRWLVGRNGDVYHYQHYDDWRHELSGLSVFSVDAGGHTVTTRVYARRAVWMSEPGMTGTAKKWTLEKGWARHFGSTFDPKDWSVFETATFDLEPPDYFVTEVPSPDHMTIRQLQSYIADLKSSGYDVLKDEVGLYRKVAFPFVTLVMTMIAIPFAVTTGRRGAMYGIGIGIVLALAYWLMISVFAALGVGGAIHPMLAAWAPNLVFGAAAAVLFLTVRT